jgi:uncharacterized protein YndB with AHSA1/START domain
MDIVHCIDIDTTPERLYQAITTQEGLAGWWAPQSKAEPKLGSLNEFNFGPERTLKFRVEQLESARRVVWSSLQVPPDWSATQVRFDITPKGHRVSRRFCHSGFASTAGSFGMTNYSWAQYIRSLKFFLETGKGEPFESPASRAAGTTPR